MRRTVFLVLAALLLLTGVALANGAPTADWHILGGGGGHVETTPYALDGTIGQAVAGMATDTDCSSRVSSLPAACATRLFIVIRAPGGPAPGAPNIRRWLASASAMAHGPKELLAGPPPGQRAQGTQQALPSPQMEATERLPDSDQ